jgi:hypothetical protein
MPRKIAAARPKRSTVRTGQYYDTRVFDGGTWAARLAAATRFQELVRKQAPGVYAMVVDKRPDGSPTRSGSISVSMVEWPGKITIKNVATGNINVTNGYIVQCQTGVHREALCHLLERNTSRKKWIRTTMR